MLEHNVSVTLIQPVAMHMDRPDTGSHLRLVDGVTEGSVSQRMLGRMSKDTKNSKLTPEMVSRKIVEVIRMRDKPVKVAMDKAKVIGTLKRFAPQSVLDKMVRGLVGLDKPAA